MHDLLLTHFSLLNYPRCARATVTPLVHPTLHRNSIQFATPLPPQITDNLTHHHHHHNAPPPPPALGLNIRPPLPRRTTNPAPTTNRHPKNAPQQPLPQIPLPLLRLRPLPNIPFQLFCCGPPPERWNLLLRPPPRSLQPSSTRIPQPTTTRGAGSKQKTVVLSDRHPIMQQHRLPQHLLPRRVDMHQNPGYWLGAGGLLPG